MPRLFVAIDLPQGAKVKLSQLCAGPLRVRWVKPENVHLTLRFIGEVDEVLAGGIAAALACIEAPSFLLHLASVGHFRAHTLWAGVGECPALMRLQSEVERVLQRLGLPPEAQPYVPHVKLGRLVGCSRWKLRKFLADNTHFRTEPFDVESFSLMASRLTPGGPIYEHRADYSLRLPTAE